MRLLRIIGVILLMAAAAAAAVWIVRKREPPPDPLVVLINQVRTRAIIEHERQLTVWYRTCPEVTGLNPEVFVIWPGRLRYSLNLSQTTLTLQGDTLTVRTPPVEIGEPSVPSDLAQFVASNPLWNFETDASLGARELQLTSPVARYLTVYFLKHDPTLGDYFRDELAAYLRGVAGALGVPVKQVVIEIPEAKLRSPAMPALQLCTGSTATANGVPFVRELNGDYTYLFPRRAPSATNRP
jgi:hypothetical protein